METAKQSMIEWGMAALPLPGQTESGDRHVVQFFTKGVLVAVVDGLGHGEDAAVAARIAKNILELHASESVISLTQQCHEALRATHGAVMSLASFNSSEQTMTWLGVGNVEGVLLHGGVGSTFVQESLSLRGGVVGHRLPRLYASVIPLTIGDMVIFVTDGICSGFEGEVRLGRPPQQIADQILRKCACGNDDALVLVVRYLDER
jgi:negative regulator of sigma-B (phosphoserine phosphatase)